MRNKTSKTLKAWAAGFLDGEGCVYIMRTKTPKHKKGYALSLRVAFTQADKKPLQLIQENWGGFVVPKRSNGRQYWGLHITSRNASRFLFDTLPYLVIKKEEAELGIEFQNQMFNRGRTLTDQEFQNQTRILETMRRLKVVGNRYRNHHDTGNQPCEPEVKI